PEILHGRVKKQNPESRIQKPEEKKICRCGLRPFHSEFWILTPESCFLPATITHHFSACLTEIHSQHFGQRDWPTAQSPSNIAICSIFKPSGWCGMRFVKTVRAACTRHARAVETFPVDSQIKSGVRVDPQIP